MHTSIGFVQGRLSSIKGNRIQSFPWGEWQNEFLKASRIKLPLIYLQNIGWMIKQIFILHD